MIDINKLIKEALKSKKKDNLKAYRNIKSEFLKYKTSGANKELTEDIQIQILKTMIKNLKKSEEAYSQAHRQDLVDECIIERLIIENLLPSPSGAEFIKLWMSTLPEVESEPEKGIFKIQKKDMGKVINQLKKQFPYNEGKEISDIVKEWVV